MKFRRLATSLLALAALAAAAPARATITPDAKAVLDRYLQASGGRAAWEKTRAMYTKASLSAFGLKGTVETWRRAPDAHASAVAIGPLAIKDWGMGGKAWRTDPSGTLLALDGKDLEDAQTSAWFENDRWLEPDQGGGSITLAGEVKDSLGTRAVLEVTPPAGKPRRLEFDRKTGMLVRTVSKSDQRTVTTTESDFRPVAGWMTAFKSVQGVEGAPANTATVQAESVWVGESIPDERFMPPAGGGAAITWLKTPNVARLPFQYRGRHVWVRASVNGGPPADFVFDTGASITVIDSAYAAQIGLQSEGKMQAQGAGSAGGASFATLDKLRLESPEGDGVELHDVKAGVLDVNSVLAPFFWRQCAGVIGFDVIVQFVNRVDYDAKQLTLFEPKSYKYDGGGTDIPMTLGGHTPVVTVKVDGRYEGPARVDVGSSSTLDLHTPFVKKNDLIAKSPKAITVTAGGFGGTFQSKYARMRAVEIGPFKVDAPLIGLSTIDQGALASEDYAGNIGNRLLERFVVTLDYERRVIHLERGAHFAERERFSMLGAQLAKYGDTVRAAQVIPGSPAAIAGLKEDDEVTEIDGKPANGFDPEQLSTRFEQGKPGDKVTLTVSRDGKPKTLRVTLKEIL